MIDFETVNHTAVATEPFTYFVAENVLHPDDLAAAQRDFPKIDGTGVYLTDELTYGPAFARLVEAIRSSRMEELMSEKLGLDLAGKPLMITVRGNCAARDGRIHTDSKDKIATALLYLNGNWEDARATGGRLRLLRGPNDMDDMLAEVSPNGGTLVAFKRSDKSWHGHYPYEGPRRYLMFNWLASRPALAKNLARHKLSARIKSFKSIAPFSRSSTGSMSIR